MSEMYRHPEDTIAELRREHAADKAEKLRWMSSAATAMAENETLRVERDAYLGLLIVPSLAKGSGYVVKNDLPTKVTGHQPTYEAALAVVRKAAGLA